MRKIKFRCFDHESEEMISPDELLTIHNNRKINESLISDDVFSFMQFIGLKDANGVEIYEGDIIGSQDNSGRAWYVSHHEIVWHDSGFMGKQICSNGSFIGISFWTQGSKGYVVIGNIYENPELLRGTTNGKS